MEVSENAPVSQLNEPEPLVSKAQLRQAMGYSERVFTKMLTALESDIKKIDPRYKKTCVLLNPKVARFIIDEFGFDILVIRRIMNDKPTPEK